MLGRDQVDELLCLVAGWDRDTLAGHFRRFRSAFPVDISADFLTTQPVDRLRHIFVALCLQNGRLPAADDGQSPLAMAA